MEYTSEFMLVFFAVHDAQVLVGYPLLSVLLLQADLGY
jgi:hypothetical protein